MLDRPNAQHRFAFAGVSFRVRAPRWELSEHYAGLTTDAGATLTVAEVECEVEAVHLPAAPPRPFSIEHATDVTRIVSSRVDVELRQLAPRRYYASGRIA